MLFGNIQKKAYEFLQTYGGLREDQLVKMLEPEVEYIDIEAIKKQLKYYNLIEINEEYITLQGRVYNPLIIKAVDVMMNFPMQDIQLHKPAPKPFVLTFFKNNKDGKLCRYDVCRCEHGSERLLSARLEGLNEKYRAILIILENIEQRQKLNITPDHCFVVLEDENYKFYKPAIKSENGEKL